MNYQHLFSYLRDFLWCLWTDFYQNYRGFMNFFCFTQQNKPEISILFCLGTVGDQSWLIRGYQFYGESLAANSSPNIPHRRQQWSLLPFSLVSAIFRIIINFYLFDIFRVRFDRRNSKKPSKLHEPASLSVRNHIYYFLLLLHFLLPLRLLLLLPFLTVSLSGGWVGGPSVPRLLFRRFASGFRISTPSQSHWCCRVYGLVSNFFFWSIKYLLNIFDIMTKQLLERPLWVKANFWNFGYRFFYDQLFQQGQ